MLSTLRISSRKSDLARLQTYMVADEIKKISPDIKIEFQFKESLGDINLTDPLWKMPEKGVFTEDFNQDLLTEKTDLVVHSWKDLPTQNRGDLIIAATLPRADQRDLLLIKKSDYNLILKTQEIKIFTSSPRRFFNIEPFLKSHFPFGLKRVDFSSVRGNVQTRLKKMMDSKEVHGLVLAKAALDRLLNNNFSDLKATRDYVHSVVQDCKWMILPLSANPNAAAQGSIAIEINGKRNDLKEFLQQINHSKTFEHTQGEREILASHGGGCHQKIGVTSLEHPYGKVLFTKGLTDQGSYLLTEVLNNSEQVKIKNKFSVNEIWNSTSNNLFFNRVDLSFDWSKYNSLSFGIFITKTINLPKINDDQLKWTSGTSTWKKCAELGYWINGCQDQLGDQFPKNCDSLLLHETQWVKLTHDQAPETVNHQTVSNYKLVRNEQKFDFDGKKCFFWASSSLYLAAVKDHPEIRSLTHCCGLGQTALVIENDLNLHLYKDTKKSLWTNLFIFCNYEQWRSYVTR